jgi:hypothetical protein
VFEYFPARSVGLGILPLDTTVQSVVESRVVMGYGRRQTCSEEEIMNERSTRKCRVVMEGDKLVRKGYTTKGLVLKEKRATKGMDDCCYGTVEIDQLGGRELNSV